MSIILDALKKIQNQESVEMPDRVASESAESRGPSAPGETVGQQTAVSIDEMVASHGVEPSFATTRMPAGQPTVAPSDIADERHRFGGIPKMLLGLILALGIFTTGWFVSRLYVDSKPAASTEMPSVQASAAQPQQVARAAEIPPPQNQLASPIPTPTVPVTGTNTPSAPAIPVSTVPSPQTASAPGVESPPQAVPPEVRDTRPRSSLAEKRSARTEESRSREKEAKSEKGGRPDLKVNAIAWRAEEPKAIVNMQRVYVGDVIEGAKVKSIQKNSVTFEYEGETFEVRF